LYIKSPDFGFLFLVSSPNKLLWQKSSGDEEFPVHIMSPVYATYTITNCTLRVPRIKTGNQNHENYK
jgi:hypothetical protein